MIGAILLSFAICAFSSGGGDDLRRKEPTLKIEFIGMKGCPNTPPMYRSLRSAMRKLGLQDEIIVLDALDLSGKNDPRAGFGTPTILVNGKDLFGDVPSGSYAPACRVYSPGLPGTNAILDSLSALKR